MNAQPHPVDSRIYFLVSTPPYIVGECSPAAAPTSTKCALNGRPEGACLANGLAAWAATPCPSVRSAESTMADPIDIPINARREIILEEFLLPAGWSCVMP